MTSIEQIVKGVMLYITSDLAPMMSPIKAATITALAPTIIAGNVKKYAAEGWLTCTGLSTGTALNIEEIYRLLRKEYSSKWPMEILGFRFTEADFDRLYNCITTS